MENDILAELVMDSGGVATFDVDETTARIILNAFEDRVTTLTFTDIRGQRIAITRSCVVSVAISTLGQRLQRAKLDMEQQHWYEHQVTKFHDEICAKYRDKKPDLGVVRGGIFGKASAKFTPIHGEDDAG